jgi:hypothetical protein
MEKLQDIEARVGKAVENFKAEQRSDINMKYLSG